MYIEEFAGCCGARIGYELHCPNDEYVARKRPITYADLVEEASDIKEAIFVTVPIAPAPEFRTLEEAYTHASLYKEIFEKGKTLYTWVNPNTGATLALILFQEADKYILQ